MTANSIAMPVLADTGPGRLLLVEAKAIALWSAAMAIVYLAFCGLAWERTLIPDEVFALVNAELSWTAQLASIRADFVHPPLIYVIERSWIALFGLSDASAKALPIAINLFAIGLFPFLAARVTPSWRLASLLFLAFYLHVFSAANLVRMYGLIVLLAIVAIWAWDAWRKRPTPLTLAAWAVTMTFAALTHFFGMLLLAAFVLIVWWRGPGRPIFTLAAAVPALTFLAWLVYVYPVYASRGLNSNLGWIEPNLARAMIVVPFHFLTMIPSGGNPVQSDWWEVMPGMKYFVLAAIALNLALLGFYFAHRRTRAQESPWLGPLTILTVVPALLLAGTSLFAGPSFHSRFVLGSLPAYWLWVVLLADGGGVRGRRVVTMLVLPVVVLAIVLPLRHDLAISPLRDVAAVVVRERQPDDIVLVNNHIGPQAYWELRRAGLDLPVQFIPASTHFARFASDLDAPARVWTFCRGECNATIRGRLVDHVFEMQVDRFLTLYRRVR